VNDRGSTLLLFPACLLVVVALASITVDLARVHLTQRALDDAAAGAANDAVTVALDLDALRSSGAYALDPTTVHRVASDSVARLHLSGVRAVQVDARVVGPRTVDVDMTAVVDLGFAGALPGGFDTRTLVGRARATAEVR
jgi:hypothetical protein